MNITSSLGLNINNTSFSGLFSKKRKNATSSNLAPLGKDTLCFSNPNKISKKPVTGFCAVAAGVLPFYARNSANAIKACEQFENNEINHIRLQNEFINAGANPESLPEIFNKITKFMPNFQDRKSQISTGELYRYTGKEEFDKLIEGKDVEARLAYNGNCFDVTTDPVLNFNDFARIKFKCDKNSENVELHDSMKDYYRIYKPTYSLDDVAQIDRILPNGYVTVYKS